jgi:hypothetical protein
MGDVPPKVLAAMKSADLGPELGAYVRECFGPFDFEGINPTLPTTTFSGRHELEAAGRRVEEVQAALQDEHLAASISFGLAELGPDDTLADLTTRGDADLYRSRRNA